MYQFIKTSKMPTIKYILIVENKIMILLLLFYSVQIISAVREIFKYILNIRL